METLSRPVAYNEIQIIEFFLKRNQQPFCVKEKPSLKYYFEDHERLQRKVLDPSNQCPVKNREEMINDDGRNSKLNFIKTPKNGIASFANRPIKRGEQILLEHPLLIINQNLERINPYEKYFAKMTDHEREIFYSLHDSTERRFTPKTFNGIINTNAFGISCGSGIFPLITRINHSCRPKAHYSWDVLNYGLALYAQVDIEEGEEVTLSYIHVTADTRSRRDSLLRSFKFECQCELCSRTNAREVQLSDMRRNRILRLKEQARYLECENPALALKKLEEVLNLYREEDMLYNANYIGEVNENYLRTLLKFAHGERNPRLISLFANYTIGNYTICYGAERTNRDFNWVRTLI